MSPSLPPSLPRSLLHQTLRRKIRPPLTLPSFHSVCTATKLSQLLQQVKPISSSTVVVSSAFLSFIPGIPFVEPCYANCIVQGYNDQGEWKQSGGGRKGKEVGDVKESEDYRKWVWERCCPGTEYEGNLPHPLEVRQSTKIRAREPSADCNLLHEYRREWFTN